ncbi:MAG: DNA-directed DNA polymerase II large subunit, partial [Candidatus Helarchaeota archaeon]
MTDNYPKFIRNYFDNLVKKVNECYIIAEKARKKGKDPEDRVEIPPAEDLASRVEELVGPPGVKKRIHELQEKGYDNEKIAFIITKEIVDGKLITGISRDDIVKLAVRAGLCILTSGITAAPIEGLADVKIRKNQDGSEYISMYFSGPIRAAGGTAAAQAVMLGDYVRKLMKLDRYKPSNEEIERYLEEITLYKRIRNLQFPIKPDSIRKAAKYCPIEITGEPTEKEEITGYRNIWRINTNKIRGGACLVLNDGIIGKAHKLLKIVENFNFSGWEWLKDLQEKDS